MNTILNQWEFAVSLVGEPIYVMEKGLIRKVGVVTDTCYHYGVSVIVHWPNWNIERVGVRRLKPFTKRSRQGYFYKQTQAEPQAQ